MTIQRSIPALAGERVRKVAVVIILRVYPRACGGTLNRKNGGFIPQGLSPRLRGNGERERVQQVSSGSIPALAGERYAVLPVSLSPWVYPRACGGTCCSGPFRVHLRGLSPRLRGNVISLLDGSGVLGSIPALAGERLPLRQTVFSGRVYPRACGGTDWMLSPDVINQGLSPRLRGNVKFFAARGCERGSIPALAGERLWLPLPTAAWRVYPRACGGTHDGIIEPANDRGLSPRLRGNANYKWDSRGRWGSIPALAGERPLVDSYSGGCRVYPRACGGT